MPHRGTLSIEKAKNLIDYNPSWPIEKGYSQYIDWYKKFKIILNLYNKDKWLTEQFGYDVYNIKNLNINILKKLIIKVSEILLF